MKRYWDRIKDYFAEGFLIVCMCIGAATAIVCLSWIIYIILDFFWHGV